MPYCTAADVAQAAGKYQTLTREETDAAGTAIGQAQAIIEKMTGTFFDSRHLEIVTEAVSARQRKLFLPAPCISLDNRQITEAGAVLTQGTDFFLYQPCLGAIPTGPGWLEKNSQSFTGWDFGAARVAWSNQQQAVVVDGVFGYTDTPADIVKVTAWKAAHLLGWITIDYTDSSGVSKAVLSNKMPDWALEILRNRSISPWDEQFYSITALA